MRASEAPSAEDGHERAAAAFAVATGEYEAALSAGNPERRADAEAALRKAGDDLSRTLGDLVAARRERVPVRRYEPGDGTMVSVFADGSTLVCSWSTSVTLDRLGIALAGLADDGGVPCDVGYRTARSFDWHVIELDGGVLGDAVVATVDGFAAGAGPGGVAVVRLESDVATWVWEAASPLADGTSVPTFGLLADLDGSALALALAAFDSTADPAARRHRGVLVDAIEQCVGGLA